MSIAQTLPGFNQLSPSLQAYVSMLETSPTFANISPSHLQDTLQNVISANSNLPDHTGNPQQGGTSPESIEQVLAKYRAGGYGPVGSAEAQQAASDDYAFVLIQSGMGSAQALTAGIKALRDFDANNFGPGTDLAATPKLPALGPNTPSPAGGAVGSDPLYGNRAEVQDLRNDAFKDWVGRTEEGRQGLFGAAIRKGNPVANPFRDYQENRFEPVNAQYIVESGLGAEPPGGFSQYATGRGTTPLSPDLWKAYLKTASTMLTNPSENMPQRQGDFREWLNESQKNQFDLALQGYLPGVAAPFQNTVRRSAANVFNDRQINTPTGDSFLPWFTGRGQRFF